MVSAGDTDGDSNARRERRRTNGSGKGRRGKRGTGWRDRMEGLGIAHAEDIYMAKVAHRITNTSCDGVRNGSARGVLLCQPHRYSMQSPRGSCIDCTRTHAPPKVANKRASANKASPVVPHQAAGGGVLNVVSCSGEGLNMLRRLHNTAAPGSRANWLLRRMEIALHCIRYICRFTCRMQNAKQAKFGISHASSEGFLRPTLAAVMGGPTTKAHQPLGSMWGNTIS